MPGPSKDHEDGHHGDIHNIKWPITGLEVSVRASLKLNQTSDSPDEEQETADIKPSETRFEMEAGVDCPCQIGRVNAELEDNQAYKEEADED